MLTVACGGSGPETESPATPLASTLTVLGEARVLNATEPALLLHPVQRVLAVYSYDSSGIRVSYRKDIDWQVDGSRIMRTSQSTIPNFDNYGYTVTSGTRFEFSADPRNPPLTINYVVYIDYQSSALDSAVKRKGSPRNNHRITCLGDSIAAGAHTVASHYRDIDDESWCGLLRRHLSADSVVINRSVLGGVLQPVWEDLDSYLSDQPDTVILAFGMNDHVAGSSALPGFSRMLEEVVARLRSQNIDVILVGFFQQNALWLQEDRAMTLAYNDAIRSVAAAHGVPFIDVYEAFTRISVGSDAYYHLTADFMHHPNNYGQRVYFSLLLPYFLTSDVMASAIPDYVAFGL
jgi:lysophospholipase L1-like esterase